MCLNRKSNIQVADKDITCYKIIQIYHRPDGDDYRSYYQHAKIELNKAITACEYLDPETTDECLYEEVVHAYIDISCDDNNIDWYIHDTKTYPISSEYDVSIVKVECIIPKGTIFCEGLGGDDNLCYGAAVIIPKRVIEKIATITREHHIYD
jgi:hypothetical protein